MVASQDLEKLEIELEKAVYKKSYYEFFKMAFCQAEPGNRLDDNWHIEYLCDIAQKEVERIARKEKRDKHLIINVPPRSAKSHIFTRMLNAWAWAYHPELKFITVSFSGSLATEHSMDTKGLINSVWYQRLYSDVFKFASDQNEKTYYKNNKGGERKARGTGSQITGSGADLIVCLRGDQKIKTDIGLVPIQEIVENKLPVSALSYNTETLKNEYKPIINYWKNPPRRLVKIIISGLEQVCTEDHRFYTINKGAVRAKELTKEDTLLKDNQGQPEKCNIDSIEYLDEKVEATYNIEVKDNHNYYTEAALQFNCDDPQDPQQATSIKEIENTIFFYDKVLASRLNNAKIGIFIVVQQRLAERDLTGHLLEDRPQYYKQISIPAEYDAQIVSPSELKERYIDGLYFPKRFGRDVLEEKRDELKGEYPGQYQQRPTFKEGAILKRNWFEIVPASSVMRDPKDPIVFFLDTAYTKKQENDPTGIMSCFYSNKDKKLYITHAGSYRKAFHELIPFIKQYVASHGYQEGSILRVEPKASGISVVDVLQNNGLNVSKIKNDFVKMDKITRANTISPYCESERVVLVEGSWNEEFLTQITSFPKSSHDEYVDVLAYAVAQYMIYNSIGFGWA